MNLFSVLLNYLAYRINCVSCDTAQKVVPRADCDAPVISGDYDDDDCYDTEVDDEDGEIHLDEDESAQDAISHD